VFADWATSIEKKNKPKEPDSSWRDIIRQIGKKQAATKALDEWRPKKLVADDSTFPNEEVVSRSRAYLGAWKRRNFGAMANLISPQVGEESQSATAEMIRSELESWSLEDYIIRCRRLRAARCLRSRRRPRTRWRSPARADAMDP